MLHRKFGTRTSVRELIAVSFVAMLVALTACSEHASTRSAGRTLSDPQTSPSDLPEVVITAHAIAADATDKGGSKTSHDERAAGSVGVKDTAAVTAGKDRRATGSTDETG